MTNKRPAAKTYYDILGIPEDADEVAIRRAFRKVIKQFHPDLNPEHRKSAKRSRQLNAAMETLLDPEKRKKYDAKLARRRRRKKSATTEFAESSKAESASTGPSERDHQFGFQSEPLQPEENETPSDHAANAPQLDPFEPEPFVQPPESFDDNEYTLDGQRKQADHFFDHNSGEELEIGPMPNRPPYHQPHQRPPVDHNLWLGIGLGAGGALLVVAIIFVVLLAIYGGDQVAGPIQNLASPGLAPRQNAPAQDSSRRGRPFPAAPQATRSRVVRTIDLLEESDVGEDDSRSDFIRETSSVVSQPIGRSLMQFSSVRPFSIYELEAKVTRLHGDGPLLIGFGVRGRPICVKIDGYSEAGYLSGIELINRRRLDQTGNPTSIVGQQLRRGREYVITCEVSAMQKVRILVNGRPIVDVDALMPRTQLNSELTDLVDGHFFLMTEDAQFRVDEFELRQINPVRL